MNGTSAIFPPPVIALFGIPVDVVDMDTVLERILMFRRQFAVDGQPRLVATVNVDFVSNSLGMLPGRVRHPELLDILCRADMTTADGMPLVWLSRLLGTALPQRVTGADLVPRLARESGKRRLRMFFLGGSGGVGQVAIETLRQRYPDMLVAGCESPFVSTEGTEMLLSQQEDTRLVQRINEARPDVLLVAFGNPKQEVWFNRNRHRLRVPVTVGIGGTFELIAGTVARAPSWMQHAGFEWLWRFMQEPSRLWRRYTIGLLKLLTLTGTLVLGNCLWRLMGGDTAVSVRNGTITMPRRLTEDAMHNVLRSMAAQPLVLDFSRTRSASMPAMGRLIRVLHQQMDATPSVGIVGLSPLFRLFLLATHTKAPLCAATAPPHARRQTSPMPRGPDMTLEKDGDITILTVTGRLDAACRATRKTEELVGTLASRVFIIDAGGITFADNSGIGLLLSLHAASTARGHNLHIAGATGAFLRMLAITRLNNVFKLHPTRAEAVAAALAE